jgi:rubrerythrin
MPDANPVEVFDLTELDTDGAIREAEEAVEGDTRAGFMRKAAIGGGAVIGASSMLGAALPELAAAKPSTKQDVAILNYALTLEYLEAAFYKEAVAKNALTGDVLAAAKIVAGHEATHVKFLKKALGSKAVKSPKFDFQGTTANQAKFLATAVVLEDTGVSAYAGQGTRIKSPAVVKAALSIHSVEARHAAHFRTLAGKGFAPRSFDRAASMKSVLKAVGKTGFIKK